MLPHGTGREARVAVFAEGEKASEAEEAGADVVGSADLAKRVEEGFTDFDVAIATPDQMGNVGRLGRVLGPRGLMPNPKTGTVTMDVAQGGARGEGRQARVPHRPRRERPRPDRQAAASTSAQLRRELRGAARRDRAREAGGREGPLHQEDHARQHDGPRHPRRPVSARAAIVDELDQEAVGGRSTAERLVDTSPSPETGWQRRADGRRSPPRRLPELARFPPASRARRQAGSIRCERRRWMQKEDKERVVAELTERLRVGRDADRRRLPRPDDAADRRPARQARSSTARSFTVVKNTLTRRAAEAAGADALLALLEGPSAIAFIESDGDMVAVAKALADSARDTKILDDPRRRHAGPARSPAADVEELAKLPPLDVLRGQVLGAIIAPLHAAARARERAAAEPGRADRRPHRAARGTGRHRRAAAAAEPSRRPRQEPSRR